MGIIQEDWLSIGQYSFILLVTVATSLIIAFGLHLLRRLRLLIKFDYSPALLVYLLSLLVGCLTLACQYALLLLSNLLPDSTSVSYSPTQLIFWSGVLPGSLLPATPVSVLFLSVDRLMIICCPSVYARRNNRASRLVALLSAFAMAALFAANLGVNLAQRPQREMPECISFGCLSSDASRLIYAINRLLVALPNFVAGSMFLTVLFSYRRRVERNASLMSTTQNAANTAVRSQQRMGDRLACWVVMFEFLLDLLPNLINFVLTALDINISVYVGAFRSLTYCLCALCSASFHTQVLWHLCRTRTVPIRQVMAKPLSNKPLTVNNIIT